MAEEKKNWIAIFGAGVAGAEAAYQLAENGFGVALFEKNNLPYGKIEEGLPKWHIKLRNQEEAKIDQKIDHPGIHFIPGIALGQQVSLGEIREVGFAAVLLAVGAWRDRPLPVEGVDRFVGKGFCYQNSFVEWFNHKHEPTCPDSEFAVPDNSIVVGGGLASLDVVKILMLETVLPALETAGVQVNLFELEREGIAPLLKRLGMRLQDLGLKGCTLFYRRRISDMPLAPLPDGANPERKQKVAKLRERIFRNFQEKYAFRAEDCTLPVEVIQSGGRMTGLVFQRTQVTERGVEKLPGTEFNVTTPLAISSIGSLPTPLPEIVKGQDHYPVEDPETGRLRGFDNVFALGNAVTGRGNIRESLIHGRQVSTIVAGELMACREDDYQGIFRGEENAVRQQVDRIAERLTGSSSIYPAIPERILAWQKASGYTGKYRQWIQNHLPIRLEEMSDKF